MAYAYRIIREFCSIGPDGRLMQHAAGDVVVFDTPRTSAAFFELVDVPVNQNQGEATTEPPKPRRGRPPKAKT